MKISVLSTLIFAISLKITAQINDTSQTDLLNFEASYVGENFNNLSGGIKKGSYYLGMANFKLGFNTQESGLWKGGQFFVNAVNTHGNTPSDLVGDFQVASNIEAGNHTYIQELWFKQSIGKFEITAGLQDLNVEFVNSEHSAYFLNSSFGIMPTISGNIPTPIFPLTSLGISLKWQVTDNSTWLVSAYDGCPTDFEDNNQYNLKWNFNKNDGILIFSEFQQSVSLGDLPATYKLGLFTHYNHRQIPEADEQPTFVKNNYGFYMIADQMLWQRSDNSKRLAMFLQLGFTPEKHNVNHYYAGAGLNFYGLLNKNGEDVLGLGIAHAEIDSPYGNESSIELTYQVPLCKNIFIQPDLQYIINPGGTVDNLKNSLATTFRFGLNF